MAYLIIDRHTGAIVGTAKTRKGARRSVDRRDNAYGAYRYQVRATPEQEALDRAAWAAERALYERGDDVAKA